MPIIDVVVIDHCELSFGEIIIVQNIFCRLIFHRSILASLSSPFFWLLAGGLLVDCLGSSVSDAVSSLPDDAEVACRTILPQFFRRSDWADLCARETSVAVGHPEACADAGFKQGQSP